MSIKVMTVRISEEMATELHAVARAEDVPVSEAMRVAIHQFIAARIADSEVRARLQKCLEKDHEVLERMSKLAREGLGGTL